MQTFLKLLFLSIVLCACATNRKVIPVVKTNCKKHLDSLGYILKPYSYGIYTWNGLPTKEYAELGTDDFNRIWAPLSREDLGIMQLEIHIDTLFNNNRHCNCEWTRQTLTQVIGHPTDIEYDGTYVYKLSYGKNFPCYTCSITNIFDDCAAFVIRFTKEGCIQGRVSFRNRKFKSY